MTTRTRHPLVCECGHTGAVCCSENDQPYSKCWESYSLDGFGGGSLKITNYAHMPENLLGYLTPTCPTCGSTKVKYA